MARLVEVFTDDPDHLARVEREMSGPTAEKAKQVQPKLASEIPPPIG